MAGTFLKSGGTLRKATAKDDVGGGAIGLVEE